MTSKSYASDKISSAGLSPAPAAMRGRWHWAWQIPIIAIGYMLTSLIAGVILGQQFEMSTSAIALLSGTLIGTTLAPIATRLQASLLSHWIVWSSVLFLNALSVAIEGAYFVPSLSPLVSMPAAWTAYLLFQSLITAGLIAWLFGRNVGSATSYPFRRRPWFSWTWRLVVSSFSYLLFYFTFGAVNYALVTKPYYAAHVSGLAVPAPQMVLVAEMARAPLIVLSIIPLILLWTGKKSRLATACGIILSVIGGVIPLLLNATLPDLLRFASAIEIFSQNFCTGLVAVGLLGFRRVRATQNQ
jgi:hypothetical protein